MRWTNNHLHILLCSPGDNVVRESSKDLQGQCRTPDRIVVVGRSEIKTPIQETELGQARGTHLLRQAHLTSDQWVRSKVGVQLEDRGAHLEAREVAVGCHGGGCRGGIGLGRKDTVCRRNGREVVVGFRRQRRLKKGFEGIKGLSLKKEET